MEPSKLGVMAAQAAKASLEAVLEKTDFDDLSKVQYWTAVYQELNKVD